MRNGRLALLGGALLVVALVLGAASLALAHPPPGANWGPGSGWGRAPMMGGWWWGSSQPLTSLEAAQGAFQAYLRQAGNQDLALDEVMEFDWNYYASVKERSTGQGAFELLADKRSGAVFPESGPTRMWNTRYGHVTGWGGRGMMGGWWRQPAPGAGPTVAPEQAEQIAVSWLDRYQPGSTVEQPDAFPGYYTLHTLQDGTMTGMLSVNAYTGQVWYHTWHGGFVRAAES